MLNVEIMKILSLNAGSSSLKFEWIELPERKVLSSGLFEKMVLLVVSILLNIMEKRLLKKKL